MVSNSFAADRKARLFCHDVFKRKGCMGSYPTSHKGGFPLRMAGEGEYVKIVGVTGGARFHDRLAGLGLAVGTTVQVVRNPMDGKLVIGCAGSRLFIGGGMAHKISVVLVGGDQQ